MKPLSLQDRLLEDSIPISESGCWIWERYTDKDGYGIMRVGPFKERAHRVSYEVYRGTVPESVCVLHKCHIPSCINPNHLYLGTHLDNTRDKINSGRRRLKKPPIPEKDVLLLLKKYKSYNAAAKSVSINPGTFYKIAQRALRRRYYAQ